MGKKVVLTISFIVAAVAFAAAISFHQSASSIPLWDKVAMAYGGVFCVFWFFDTAGKKVAKKFADADEEPARPAPHPSSDPRQRPVLAGDVRYSAVSRSDSLSHTSKFAQGEESGIGTSTNADLQINANFSGLSLERLRSSQASEWQDMLDDFAVETLALDGVQPERGEDGHVTAWRADKLLSREGCYSFWIQWNGERIGTVAVTQIEMDEKHSGSERNEISERGDTSERRGTSERSSRDVLIQIEVIYVRSSWRRRGIARAVLEKLIEFLLLLHESCALQSTISNNNYRARSYLQACGFISDREDITKADFGIDRPELGTDRPVDENSRQYWLRMVP